MSLVKSEIIAEFEAVRELLGLVVPAMKRELHASLQSAGIPIHGFTARLKESDSLLKKISRPDRTYARIWDITDLIGFRIVTAFEDSIEDVARVVESRYEVDLALSRNKLQYDDHERFGYRSLHYVCRLPKSVELPAHWLELARFEIQVRTSLQDVWAEIEHDLGYKATDLASHTLRRRFSRISSLLEIADEELVAVKSELRRYVDERRNHSHLDMVSLKELIAAPEVAGVDTEIAKMLKLEKSREPFFPDYLLRGLRFSGLTTVQEVLKSILKDQKKIVAFVPVYFEFAERALGFPLSALKAVPQAYSLLFLAHVRLIESEPLAVNRVRRFANFYSALDFPDDERKAYEVAGALIRTIENAPSASTAECHA